jgi:threonine/homoserine/homoserine lactone efflux protein
MFIIAGLMLNITPGADLLYIGSRSAAQGTKAGVAAALGIGVGCILHIILATLGLSVVLATSAFAFNIVKLAGATYLAFLGIRMLWTKKRENETVDVQPNLAAIPLSYGKIFLQAILVNILNPKVALFFMAFLPQFVAHDAIHPAIAFLFLGCLFNFNGSIVNVLFAIFFSRIFAGMKKNVGLSGLLQKVAGLIFVGLGLRLAFVTQE